MLLSVSDTLSQLAVLLSVSDTFSYLAVVLSVDRINPTPKCVQQDVTNTSSFESWVIFISRKLFSQNSSHRIIGKPNYYITKLVLQLPTRTSTLRSDGSYRSVQGSAV